MMKFIREIFALVLIMSLVACGGGGGSPGNTSNNVDFFVSAPSTLVMLPGETRTFSIGGGVPAYSVSTSNSAIQASISDKVLTLKAVGTGSATVVVKDATGKSSSIEVTLGSGIDLFTTAPSTVVVGVGLTSEVFSIGGGSRVFEVSSSDTRIATVAMRGDQFIITGVNGGKATVTVADTLSKKVSIDVIVGSNDAIFTTAGTDVTLGIGNANLYKVGGGTTVYSVSSADTNIATAKITGSDLLITGIATGKTVVNVRDSAGNPLSINVTVGLGGVELFTTAPATLVLPVGSSAANFAIGGGKAPYAAISSNAAVVVATVSGTNMSLRPIAAGTATVSITDALGKKISVSVTVGSGTNVDLFTDAPSAVTLTVDAVRSYKVAGGTGPYSVTSSNGDVIEVVNQPSTNNGNVFDIKAKAIGSANVVIKDSLGKTVTIAVTVNSGSAVILSSLPAAGGGRIGEVVSFKLVGGSPAYAIANSNPNVATAPASVTNSGDSFTVTLVNVGTTTLTVTDTKGQSIAIVVTVTAENNVLRVQPNSLAITADELNTKDITLYVYGGKPGYTVFVGNTKGPTPTLTPTANGAILQLAHKDCRAGAAGPITYSYTIVDSVGASVIANLTLDKICP